MTFLRMLSVMFFYADTTLYFKVEKVDIDIDIQWRSNWKHQYKGHSQTRINFWNHKCCAKMSKVNNIGEWVQYHYGKAYIGMSFYVDVIAAAGIAEIKK